MANTHTDTSGKSTPPSPGGNASVASEHALRVVRSALSPLVPYFDDQSTQEIMINSPGDIWIERAGVFQKIEVTLSENSVRASLQALASLNDKSLRPTAKDGHDVIMDCRMESMRIAAALPPVAINGYALSIRKHSKSNRRLQDYLNTGAFNVRTNAHVASVNALRPSDQEISTGGEYLHRFIRWAVAARKNIMVSGGTSSGKTTFLNALVAEIDPTHRIITIEDTPELQVVSPNYVGFCANEELGVDIHRLVRLTLRFRPDRIIVGEIRGAEAFDLLDGLNTGHTGGYCSLHADSGLLALSRLENLVRKSPDMKTTPIELIRAQIAATFDFVIHTARIDGQRGPVEVLSVDGYDLVHGKYLTKGLFHSCQLPLVQS